MKVFFSVFMVAAINIAGYASAGNLPYSNVEAIHNSEVVLVGKIQYQNQTQKSLRGYELPRSTSGQEGLVTKVEFVVADNLGDGNYSAGKKIGLEIPEATLEKLAQGKNGNLLAQSKDVLLGLDVLETDASGAPLRYSVKTQEFIIADNVEELHNWVDSIRDADTPALNRLMAKEWNEKGFDGAALQKKLDHEYDVRINSPIPDDSEKFRLDAMQNPDVVTAKPSNNLVVASENTTNNLIADATESNNRVESQTFSNSPVKNEPKKGISIYILLAAFFILAFFVFWFYTSRK